MALRNKTIVTKKNGSIFIPNKIIRAEYPAKDDKSDSGSDDKLYYIKIDLTKFTSKTLYFAQTGNQNTSSTSEQYLGYYVGNKDIGNISKYIFDVNKFLDYYPNYKIDLLNYDVYLKAKKNSISNKFVSTKLLGLFKVKESAYSYIQCENLEFYSNKREPLEIIINYFNKNLLYETNIK